MVVNNNAAAVFLGLSALAQGKEVIVSRGEAVEIGGGFRVPDVLAQSGARLVEVGTTNRTYVSDYESALTPDTGALLKVHASNFRVEGFTHSCDTRELAELGKRSGLPVLHDVGSGCLLDTEEFGLAHEPTPQESITAGADLVFFSGDKLLGGPQAGIVAGKSDLIRTLERHPLARALRIDKLSLAALTATLLHYLKGEARSRIPIWQMIGSPVEDMRERSKEWCANIGEAAILCEGLSTIGGGSLPRRDHPHLGRGLKLQRCPRRRRGCDGSPPQRPPAHHRPHRAGPGDAGPENRTLRRRGSPSARSQGSAGRSVITPLWSCVYSHVPTW